MTLGWKISHRILGVKPGFRILMYHAVGTSIPEDRIGLYNLSPKCFAEQMKLLVATAMDPVLSFTEAATARRGLAITFDDGYRDVLTNAAPILARLGLPFTVFATSGYINSGNNLYLSPQELRELASYPGVSIGAHGATHIKFTMCSDNELNRQLIDSRNYFEDLLQYPVKTLSYPYGAVDARVRAAARNAGYMLGACSRFGTNYADRDLMSLNRTDIWSSDGLDEFDDKLTGNWDWMRWRS